MSLELFRAVQAARLLLEEGHPLARASTVAAAEFGARPEEVARLADEAHRACTAARAHRTQTARPAGGPAVALPEPAAAGATPDETR